MKLLKLSVNDLMAEMLKFRITHKNLLFALTLSF